MIVQRWVSNAIREVVREYCRRMALDEPEKISSDIINNRGTDAANLYRGPVYHIVHELGYSARDAAHTLNVGIAEHAAMRSRWAAASRGCAGSGEAESMGLALGGILRLAGFGVGFGGAGPDGTPREVEGGGCCGDSLARGVPDLVAARDCDIERRRRAVVAGYSACSRVQKPFVGARCGDADIEELAGILAELYHNGDDTLPPIAWEGMDEDEREIWVGLARAAKSHINRSDENARNQ